MELIKLIAEDNDKTVTINNMEFDSLIISLNNKQVDACIAGMTVTDERKEEVDFSTPYYVATQVMIVKEGSDIEKATDMKDKTIAVVQGYTGETVVKELGYEYEAFKKGTEAIEELKNKKCDVVVIDSATAAAYLNENKGLAIVEDEDAFSSEEYAIAVKKGDNIMFVESMKMEIPMVAPQDGTVASIDCAVGDSVEAGAVLATLN